MTVSDDRSVSLTLGYDCVSYCRLAAHLDVSGCFTTCSALYREVVAGAAPSSLSTPTTRATVKQLKLQKYQLSEIATMTDNCR